MRTLLQKSVKLILGLVALAMFLVALPTDAHAAVNIFVKVDGVDGESRDARHANWIEASAYSEGVASTGRPQFQNLQITKNVDAASVGLASAAVTGKHIPSVTLEFVRPGGKGDTVIFRIVLKDVSVASIARQHTSSGPLPTETVALAASSYQWSYTPIRADGSAGPTITGGYDLRAAKAL